MLLLLPLLLQFGNVKLILSVTSSTAVSLLMSMHSVHVNCSTIVPTVGGAFVNLLLLPLLLPLGSTAVLMLSPRLLCTTTAIHRAL